MSVIDINSDILLSVGYIQIVRSLNSEISVNEGFSLIFIVKTHKLCPLTLSPTITTNMKNSYGAQSAKLIIFSSTR
jgi:hypothetical protein